MICDAIDAAQAVIVVWSPASVRSRFVLDEAERSLDASKLVTTHVEKFRLRQVPLGFGRLHTIPVTDHEEIRRSLLKHGVVLRA
jgi:hypothetical protein